MGKIPDIVPITDLRQDATAILKRASKSGRPVVITQRGRAAAVLLSMEAFERSQNEFDILRLLARGEKEIEEGKGYEFAEVLKEADALLDEEGR